MLFECGRNAFKYFAFLFSAETKIMYHACKCSSPDIQESLYVTYIQFLRSYPHDCKAEERELTGGEESEATTCVVIAAESDSNIQHQTEGGNYS
jgi:hypothetical protein